MPDSEKQRTGQGTTVPKWLKRDGHFETGDIDEMNVRDLDLFMQMSDEERQGVPQPARQELEKHEKSMEELRDIANPVAARFAEVTESLRYNVTETTKPPPAYDPPAFFYREPASPNLLPRNEQTVLLADEDRALFREIRDRLRRLDA